MNDTRLLELEQRMQLLEEEVRCLRSWKSSPFRLGVLGLALIGGLSITVIGLPGNRPASAEPAKGKDVARPTTVIEAPVDIRGKSGKTVVRIEDDPVPALWLIGPQGSVKLVITDLGGAVSVRAAAAQPSFLGFDSNGTGLVALTGTSGSRVAELGQNGAQVFNGAGKVVARLGTSSKDEGLFLLGNAGGDATVEAGTLEGRGIVRAYPYSPRTGEILRGSNFIVGAKK